MAGPYSLYALFKVGPRREKVKSFERQLAALNGEIPPPPRPAIGGADDLQASCKTRVENNNS